MDLEAFLCTFMHLNQINFLQTDLVLSPVISNCTSTTFVNPLGCENGFHFGLPSSTFPFITRHRPVVVATSVALKFLRFLEETCYPSVHVWCRPKKLSSLPKTFPKECDGFVVSDHVEPARVIETFSTADVDAFASRTNFQICSDFGILNDDGSVHKNVAGLSVRHVVNEHDIYTGPLRPASEISDHLSGKIQGFELSLLQVIEKQFNFSSENFVSSTRPPLVGHGRQPEYESSFFENSVWGYRQTMGYVMRKEAVFLYGDFSVLDPRQHYIEPVSIHDVDSNAFMSTVAARKISGISMLMVCGPAVTGLYLLSAFVVSSIIFYVRRKPGFLHVLVIIGCMILQQSTPPPRESLKPARCVEQVWRIGVFSLACIVSARLVTLLTNSELDGKFESIEQIAKFVISSDDVWIFHDSRVNHFSSIRHGTSHHHSLEILADRAVPCAVYTNECFDRLVEQRTSLVFGEGLSIKRQAWQRGLTRKTHVVPENLNNCFQAFAMQKRCMLHRMFSKVVRRLVDAGLVEAFKNRAGLEYSDEIRITVLHQLELADIQSAFFSVIVIQVTCLICLILELLHFLFFVKLSPKCKRKRLRRARKLPSPCLSVF